MRMREHVEDASHVLDGVAAPVAHGLGVEPAALLEVLLHGHEPADALHLVVLTEVDGAAFVQQA